MEDVVIYTVDIDNGCETVSWGRDTLEVSKEFIRRPKWPASVNSTFIAVDDWGHGNIVAATPILSNWIGESFAKFKREAH